MGKEEDVVKVVKQATLSLGGLDIIISNAVCPSPTPPIVSAPLIHFRDTLDFPLSLI